MAPILPYDVWSIIYQYIPSYQRIKLHGLNAAVFQLVMDEIYSRLEVFNCEGGDSERCLTNMSPIIATRIKSLNLRPHLLGELLRFESIASRLIEHVQLPSLKLSPITFSQHSHSTNDVHRTPSQKAQALLDHLLQMTSLSEFKISCYPCDDGNMLLKSITFIEAAWLGIRNARTNLSKLELILPIEVFDGVVSGAPVLSQLETLVLGIRENEPMDSASETQYRGKRIAEFVNTKCSNVRSLSLTLRILFDTVNSFLPALQPLHNLSHLSLNIPIIYLVDFNVPLSPFLSSHSQTLHELDISLEGSLGRADLPSPQVVLASSIFNVSFPRLRSLTLDLVQWDYKDAQDRSTIARFLTSYLARLRLTLTCLRIEGYIFTFDQVISFMDVLGGERGNLEKLGLQLHFLSCDLLRFLSNKFHHLEKLDLAFDYVCNTTEIPFIPHNISWGERNSMIDATSKDFFDEMKRMEFPDWSLRQLTLEFRDYDLFPDNDYNRTYAAFKKALAKTLPGVEEFNGLDRQSFLPRGYDMTLLGNLAI